MTMEETPAAALERLRKEGRWDSARAWQEAERLRMRAEGVPKAQAREKAFTAMLGAFPAVTWPAAGKPAAEDPTVPKDFWKFVTATQFPPEVPREHTAFIPVWVAYYVLRAELACREVETAENRALRITAADYAKAHNPADAVGLCDLTESAPLLLLALAQPVFERAHEAVKGAGDELAAAELAAYIREWGDLADAVREHWPVAEGPGIVE